MLFSQIIKDTQNSLWIRDEIGNNVKDVKLIFKILNNYIQQMRSCINIEWKSLNNTYLNECAISRSSKDTESKILVFFY